VWVFATQGLKNGKICKVKLTEWGPKLSEETKIKMKQWPLKDDALGDIAKSIFKKDNYLILFSKLRLIGVFEIIN
jgi:hypothetical protein